MMIQNCLKLLQELGQLEKEILALENSLQSRHSGLDLDTILVKHIAHQLEKKNGRKHERTHREKP